MKSFFKFIGALVYGAVMSYLLWLFFYWLTPVVMSFSWVWLMASVMGGGLIFFSVGSLIPILIAPWIMLGVKCKPARYAPIPFLIIFGFSSVRLPWLFGDNYGFLQWILWASLTIAILLTFGGLLYVAFNHESFWED